MGEKVGSCTTVSVGEPDETAGAQEVKIRATSKTVLMFLTFIVTFLYSERPNGWCYWQVGGERQRHFIGTSLEPKKLLENAQTPTTPAPACFAGVRVHAVLGGSWLTDKIISCVSQFYCLTRSPAVCIYLQCS